MNFRNVLRLLSGRLFWIALLILIQFFVLMYVVLWASYKQGLYIAFSFLSILMLFGVFTRQEKPAYKMVWLFLIGIFPVFGGVLYLVMANKKLGYFSRKKTAKFRQSLPDSSLFADDADSSIPEYAYDYHRISQYIKNVTGLPAWGNTECRYFPYSEEFFLDVIDEIRKAERFIFIEYFIIGEGKWWDSILKELRKKADEGVDVRIIYDDLGSINALPPKYRKQENPK